MKSESSKKVVSSTWSEIGVSAESRQVDDWIRIETDGTITVFSGKVELGTGVRTALAQIVAEELDVPLERIRMVMGDTTQTPDEGYTAGSRTIRSGGSALRQASAEARRAFLELASEWLSAELDELVVSGGVVSVRHDPSRSTTYVEMMGGKRFGRLISGRAPLKQPADYLAVGQPVPRVDLPAKFTGRASFVHDIRLPGMLHARVVRPPSVGAQLISVNDLAATNAQVIRLGDFLAVLAEQEHVAVQAARELKAIWKESAHLPAMGELYGYLRDQPTMDEVVCESGDLSRGLGQAVTSIQATYYQSYHAHGSIGPSCAVAQMQDHLVRIWCSTQGVYPLRRALSSLLNVPVDQIEVTHTEGAGCYGHNGADDVAAEAAILAREIGRPVRVQWSREEEFAWEPFAPAMVMQVRGGLDARGSVVAWDYQAWSPSHANHAEDGSPFLVDQLVFGRAVPPFAVFRGGSRNAPTNYRFPNQRVTMHWLQRSPLRVSSFRSLGAFANTFANESFMDELAIAAQVDPLDFRLRQLADARAEAVLKAAAQNARWGRPLPAGEGQGIAFAQYENDQAHVAAVAHVEVSLPEGQVRVRRVAIAHDCGLIINPDGLRNQIEGAVMQSVSRALKEQVTFDQTRVTSLDWDSYPILRFSEVPEVEITLINRPDQPPLGAGEPATVVVAPAIANAIFAAVRIRVRQVPFTPLQVRNARS